MMIDARANMIKQQLRTWEVTNEHLLHLFERIDRLHFVNPAHRDLAYADMALPLMNGEQMLSPAVQAKMVQALELEPHETVLEIGTGNGFMTALLAGMAKEVISIEFHKDIHHLAAQNLKNQGVLNIQLMMGNGANGVKLKEAVDAVVITGALAFLPNPFQSCIKPKGRILAILGEAKNMHVTHIQKQGSQYVQKALFETVTTPLLRAPEKEHFVF